MLGHFGILQKNKKFKMGKVIFSIISEKFGERHIIGTTLSIRRGETIIEIWINYFKYDKIKNMMAVTFGV